MDNVEAKGFDEGKVNGSRDTPERVESPHSIRDRDPFHDIAQSGTRRRSNAGESGYDRDGLVWILFFFISALLQPNMLLENAQALQESDILTVFDLSCCLPPIASTLL